jgi:DNA-binding NarL/FixJ family response regulator
MRAMLGSQHEFECAGSSADPAMLLKELASQPVDLLILDLDIDYGHGHPLQYCYKLCRQLQAAYPALRIVLHSPLRHANWANAFLALGVKGIISKDTDFSETYTCLLEVSAGHVSFCKEIKRQLNATAFRQTFDEMEEADPAMPVFTAREKTVLSLLIQGYSSKEMAEELHVSLKTIESHRQHLVYKAKVKNTAELISFVFRYGLVV